MFSDEARPLTDLLNAKKATEELWNKMLRDMGGARAYLRGAKKLQEAQMAFRGFVGCWIDSGFQPDNSEIQGSRNYNNIGVREVFELMEELFHCSLTIPQKNILALQADARPNPLYGTISMLVRPHGGFDLVRPKYNQALPPRLLATWAFVLFWQSPWLFKLVRCQVCGRFAVSRRTPEKPRKYGWFCVRHQNGRASAAMNRHRERDEVLWVRQAAVTWLAYGKQSHTTTLVRSRSKVTADWHRSRSKAELDRRRRKDIAEKLNNHFGLHFGRKFTPHLIARHQDKIQEAVEAIRREGLPVWMTPADIERIQKAAKERKDAI